MTRFRENNRRMSGHGITKRQLYVDVARAMAITMIVMAHVLRTGVVADYLGSTGVTMFFFLSGYVYRWKEDRRAYWLGRIRRLVIPYLAVATVSILIYHAAGRFAAAQICTDIGTTDILPNLAAMLYANSKDHSMKWNETLWFVPCFLAVLIMANLLERWIVWRGKKGCDLSAEIVRLAAIGTSLCLHYFLTQRNDLRLPWQWETAFAMLPTFEAGILAHTAISVHDAQAYTNDIKLGKCGDFRPIRLTTGTALGIALLSIALEIILTPINGQISIRGDIYTHYALSFLILALGVAGYILLAYGIVRVIALCATKTNILAPTRALLHVKPQAITSRQGDMSSDDFTDPGSASFAHPEDIRRKESAGSQISAAGDNRFLCLASYVGRHSFDIMLWNKFPVLIFQTLLPVVIHGFDDLYEAQDNLRGVLISIPLTLVCIALCLLWTAFYQHIKHH